MATFGNTSIDGIEWYALPTDTHIGNRFTLSEQGSVTKISMYVRNTSDTYTQALKACIYDDDGATQFTGTLMGVTPAEVIGVLTAEGWADFTLSSPVSLAAGDWWLTCHGGDDTEAAEIARQATGGTASVYQADEYDDGPADPLTMGSAGTRNYCVYATYTAEVVGARYYYASLYRD